MAERIEVPLVPGTRGKEHRKNARLPRRVEDGFALLILDRAHVLHTAHIMYAVHSCFLTEAGQPSRPQPSHHASPAPPHLLRSAALCRRDAPEAPCSVILPCYPRRAPRRFPPAPARTRAARREDQSPRAIDRAQTCTRPAAGEGPATDSTSIACRQSGCALGACFRLPPCGRPDG